MHTRPFFICMVILFSIPAMNVYSNSEINSEQNEDASSVLLSYFSKCLSFKSQKKKGEGDKRWFYSIAGWYGKKSGNTNTLTSNLETTLEWDDNISNFIISYSTFYGEADDRRNENKGTGIIKYDHYIIPRVEFFIFSQSYYNRAALLDHRNNSGIGSKLVFIRNEILKVDASGAIIYQYENYESNSPDKDYRWSFRFRIKITPLKMLKFQYAYFYIPEVDDYMRYRLKLDTSLSLEINKYLSFKLGYINEYNKNALSGTKKTDENLYSQLSLNL